MVDADEHLRAVEELRSALEQMREAYASQIRQLVERMSAGGDSVKQLALKLAQLEATNNALEERARAQEKERQRLEDELRRLRRLVADESARRRDAECTLAQMLVLVERLPSGTNHQ